MITLVDIAVETGRAEGATPAWSRVIWDIAAVAWLLDEAFVLDRLERSPVPESDGRYAFDSTRHFIRYVYHVDRDKIFFRFIF